MSNINIYAVIDIWSTLWIIILAWFSYKITKLKKVIIVLIWKLVSLIVVHPENTDF